MRIAHQSSQQNPQETLTAAGFACTREIIVSSSRNYKMTLVFSLSRNNLTGTPLLHRVTQGSNPFHRYRHIVTRSKRPYSCRRTCEHNITGQQGHHLGNMPDNQV